MALFKYPKSEEPESFGEQLLKQLLVTGLGAAVQGGISGGLGQYFGNKQADADQARKLDMAERMANQGNVEKMQTRLWEATESMPPADRLKMFEENKATPEFAFQSMPDWSGDRGAKLPKPTPAYNNPRAFLQILSNKLPMGPQDETAGFRGPLQPGQSAPSLDVPFEEGMKGTTVSVGSPMEKYAEENPKAASWFNIPKDKKALESKNFIGQLNATQRAEAASNKLDFEKTKHGEELAFKKQQWGDQKSQFEEKMKLLRERIDLQKQNPRNSQKALQAELLSKAALQAWNAAWTPEKGIMNKGLADQAKGWMNQALELTGAVDKGKGLPTTTRSDADIRQEMSSKVGGKKKPEDWTPDEVKAYEAS